MTAIDRAFDLLLAPAGARSPWFGMAILSLLAAVIVLLVFRLTSRQSRIRTKKDRAVAALLELALFRDHPRLALAAFGRLLVADLSYLAEMIVPLCVTALPLCIIMGQACACLAHRPLRKDEAALLKVRFPAGRLLVEQDVSITTSSKVAVETAAVRAPALGEYAWRVRALKEGDGHVGLRVNDTEIDKSVRVHSRQRRVSPVRVQSGLLNRLGRTSDPPLPMSCAAEAIEMDYPICRYVVLGVDLGWFWAFCVLTLLFAAALKKPFGVEI